MKAQPQPDIATSTLHPVFRSINRSSHFFRDMSGQSVFSGAQVKLAEGGAGHHGGDGLSESPEAVYDTEDVMFFNQSLAEHMDSDITTASSNSLPSGGHIMYEPYELVWTPEVMFRVTALIVVMAFTLVGNTTLIAIIMSHEKLRKKRVNIFLVNLAVGDLMVCLVTMTTEILFVAFGEWVLGQAACKLIVYGQIVTLASATFLLTGMSIDRYQVIVQPLQSLTGQPKIWRKVLLAWVCALIFAVPQFFIFVQVEVGSHPDGRPKHMCLSKGYTSQWQRKFYFSFLTTYILLIPTLIMSFCYVKIIRVVWMRSDSDKAGHQPRLRFISSMARSRDPHSHSSHPGGAGTRGRGPPFGLVLGEEDIPVNTISIPQKLVSSSKRNVIKMTLTVILGFVTCWTPYFVVSLIRIFSDYEIKLSQALIVAEIMALVHSALNPILYGIFSTTVTRKVCRQICWRCSKNGKGQGRNRGNDSAFLEEETTLTWAESNRVNRVSIVVPVMPPPGPSTGETTRKTLQNMWNRFKRLFSCARGNPESEPAKSKPLLIYSKLFPNSKSRYGSGDACNHANACFGDICSCTKSKAVDKATVSDSAPCDVASYELQNISTYGDPMLTDYQALRLAAQRYYQTRSRQAPLAGVGNGHVSRDPEVLSDPDCPLSESQSDLSLAHTYSASGSESELPGSTRNDPDYQERPGETE